MLKPAGSSESQIHSKLSKLAAVADDQMLKHFPTQGLSMDATAIAEAPKRKAGGFCYSTFYGA